MMDAPEVSRSATSDLPHPDELAAAYARMEGAVRGEYDRWEEQANEARDILQQCEEAMAGLRAAYPMIFPPEPESRRKMVGQPSTEQKNAVLRAIAEHPGSTYRQLGRRLNYSVSWVGRIIQVINAEHGQLIGRGRNGRSLIFRLTEEGDSVLGRGGIRGT